MPTIHTILIARPARLRPGFMAACHNKLIFKKHRLYASHQSELWMVHRMTEKRPYASWMLRAKITNPFPSVIALNCGIFLSVHRKDLGVYPVLCDSVPVPPNSQSDIIWYVLWWGRFRCKKVFATMLMMLTTSVGIIGRRVRIGRTFEGTRFEGPCPISPRHVPFLELPQRLQCRELHPSMAISLRYSTFRWRR